MKPGLNEMVLRPVAPSQDWEESGWMQRDAQRLLVAWAALFTVRKWRGGGRWGDREGRLGARGHTQPL